MRQIAFLCDRRLCHAYWHFHRMFYDAHRKLCGASNDNRWLNYCSYITAHPSLRRQPSPDNSNSNDESCHHENDHACRKSHDEGDRNTRVALISILIACFRGRDHQRRNSIHFFDLKAQGDCKCLWRRRQALKSSDGGIAHAFAWHSDNSGDAHAGGAHIQRDVVR